MARTELDRWVADFERVAGAMRRMSVIVCTGTPVGDVTLGPEPVKVSRTAKGDPDPYAERRAYYSDVLNRPVSNGELDKLP